MVNEHTNKIAHIYTQLKLGGPTRRKVIFIHAKETDNCTTVAGGSPGGKGGVVRALGVRQTYCCMMSLSTCEYR